MLAQLEAFRYGGLRWPNVAQVKTKLRDSPRQPAPPNQFVPPVGHEEQRLGRALRVFTELSRCAPIDCADMTFWEFSNFSDKT